jgi:hypothetical protein
MTGTVWHRADRAALVALALAWSCGGNSHSTSPDRDWTPDAGTPDGDIPDGDTPDGGTPDGDTPDGGTSPPPAESFQPGDAAPCGGGTVWDHILEPTEAHARARMSTLSGYADPGLVVYRGMATVRDTRGDHSIEGNGEITGEVLAKLEASAGSELGLEPGYLLTIKSVDSDEYVLVHQSTLSRATYVSGVTPPNSSPYGGGDVDPSVEMPDFETEPTRVTLDISAANADPNYRIEVALSTTLEEVETVTFPDLAKLVTYYDSSLEGFEPNADGSEYTREIADRADIPACVPEGSGFLPGECTYLVSYTAEEFIETNALDVHELRNFIITHALLDCYHCDRSEGFSDSYRCLEGQRSRRYP